VLRVSVIIPTLNRAGVLGRTLRSIVAVVDSSDPVEIIVVDNGSVDQTAEVFREIRVMFPQYEWRYFYEPVPGLLSGRHRGAKEARGEILSFLDDDVTLPARWMESILQPFGDPDIHFVGCRYLPDYDHAPPFWTEGLWQEHDDGFRTLGHLSLLDGGELSRPYRPMLVWGLCFAARRETVIKLGGFNPDGYPWELRRFRGDGESGLASKAEMLGFKAFYQGKTHVKHHVPASRMTPEYFERRSFLQGISDSYTQIRRDCRVPGAPGRSWKDLLRPAKWKIERDLILRRPTAEGVARRMVRAHRAGMQFHENAARNDPKVLDWVLRQNYLDPRLPDGWTQYLNARKDQPPRPA
jgi:hypothetical protein